jgi:hypothetical protein
MRLPHPELLAGIVGTQKSPAQKLSVEPRMNTNSPLKILHWQSVDGELNERNYTANHVVLIFRLQPTTSQQPAHSVHPIGS